MYDCRKKKKKATIDYLIHLLNNGVKYKAFEENKNRSYVYILFSSIFSCHSDQFSTIQRTPFSLLINWRQ